MISVYHVSEKKQIGENLEKIQFVYGNVKRNQIKWKQKFLEG